MPLGTIVVPNFSFGPSLEDGGSTSGADTVPSWTGTASNELIQMGVENPTAARYDQVDDVISDPLAQGKQCAYINTFAPDETGSFASVPRWPRSKPASTILLR